MSAGNGVGGRGLAQNNLGNSLIIIGCMVFESRAAGTGFVLDKVNHHILRNDGSRIGTKIENRL